MAALSGVDYIELLMRSLRDNFLNDYPEELALDRVSNVCDLFCRIIAMPSDAHEGAFAATVANNPGIKRELTFCVKRLHKYGNPLPVGIRLMNLGEEARRHADYSKMFYANEPSRLKNVWTNIEGRTVANRVEEYFGDNRTRQLEPAGRGVAKLTHSIWSARCVDRIDKTWVWRAENLIDRCDVFKLLKFLTSDPGTPQSIQINIEESSDFTLPVERILLEVKICIACLQVSPEQFKNIAIALPGRPNLYPENADHVIDTLWNKACAVADRYANYKNLMRMSVPDCLKRSRIMLNRMIIVEYREMCEYLGDGRSRRVEPSVDYNRLFKLTYSCWLAQKTSDKRWIWRAKNAVFHSDVFKLLKFLTSQPDFPFAIQINTGCHGDSNGRSAHDLRDPTLSDSRILEEIKLCIACLRVSPDHLKNIAIATPGSEQKNLYPKNADHIIDTHCYGAHYPAMGIGLQAPLPFLYKYADHFTEVDWVWWFGEVDNVPSLPGNIDETLNAECPFCPGMKVSDTHFLCLMPGTFNGDRFTLSALMQHSKKSGKLPNYSFDILASARDVGTMSFSSSYWALVTRKPVSINAHRVTALEFVRKRGYDATFAVEAHSICYLFFAKRRKNMLCYPTYCLDEPLFVNSQIVGNRYNSAETRITEKGSPNTGMLAIKRFIGDTEERTDNLWPRYDLTRGHLPSPTESSTQLETAL